MKSYLFPAIILGVGAALPAHASTRVGIGLNIGIPAPVRVYEAPPPRVVERVVSAPAPGYVWVPGHYTFVEGRWHWLGGAWVMPPRPDAYWVEGRWIAETRQWVEPHWEIAAPPPPPPGQPAAPNGPPPGAPTSAAPAQGQGQAPAPGAQPNGVATPSPAPNVVQVPTVPGAPAGNEVVMAEPPPPPQQEVIVERPGPDFVWISGYWGFDGGRREWFRGHWERPPHGFNAWVAPRWEPRGRNYVFVRGYWR